MGAIEFSARVGPDRTLKLPAEVAEQLREDQTVRVLLVPETDEDEVWTRFAAEQLLRQYADEDSVYDDVDLPTR
jgi:hypothetical protein